MYVLIFILIALCVCHFIGARGLSVIAKQRNLSQEFLAWIPLGQRFVIWNLTKDQITNKTHRKVLFFCGLILPIPAILFIFGGTGYLIYSIGALEQSAAEEPSFLFFVSFFAYTLGLIICWFIYLGSLAAMAYLDRFIIDSYEGESKYTMPLTIPSLRMYSMIRYYKIATERIQN